MHNPHAPNDKRDTKEPARQLQAYGMFAHSQGTPAEHTESTVVEQGPAPGVIIPPASRPANEAACDNAIEDQHLRAPPALRGDVEEELQPHALIGTAFADLQTALRVYGYTGFAADVARLADNFTIAPLWGEASGQSRQGDGTASPSKKRKNCPRYWCRGCAHQEYVDTHPEVVDEMNKLAKEKNWEGLDKCLQMISTNVTKQARKRDPHATLCKHDMIGWANGIKEVARHLLCNPSRRYEVKCVQRCSGPQARRGGCACRMCYHVQSRHAPATHKSLIPPPPSV